MSNLIETLLSIKNPRNNFIERPELIQGYTEDEIKQIEQKHSFPNSNYIYSPPPRHQNVMK